MLIESFFDSAAILLYQPIALGRTSRAWWLAWTNCCAEIIKYLKKCGEACAHIHILPVYHLSLPAHNSHHGSFGRGVSERSIDCR